MREGQQARNADAEYVRAEQQREAVAAEVRDGADAGKEMIEKMHGAIFNLMNASGPDHAIDLSQEDLDILGKLDTEILPRATARIEKIYERGPAFFGLE